jgi:hypothetical protein
VPPDLISKLGQRQRPQPDGGQSDGGEVEGGRATRASLDVGVIVASATFPRVREPDGGAGLAPDREALDRDHREQRDDNDLKSRTRIADRGASHPRGRVHS